MTDGEARACKPERNGVYRFPQDIGRLRAVVLGEGGMWRVVDLTGITDKQGLLGAIAQVLQFPGHFGSNWDALADSLQDLSWLSWSALVIEARGWNGFARAAADEAGTALDIARNAATYWAGRGKTFIVLLDQAPDLQSLT